MPRAKRTIAEGWALVEAISAEWEGVERTLSYGTVALKRKKKLFARLQENGSTMVLRTTMMDRDHLMRTAPEVFYLTDHYQDHPWVLVHLALITKTQLSEVLRDAWERAGKKVAGH
jgi:hypothetical protein